MKNRKRGFSLVELLIVLAVIAALIATITPVALNAIRKSQATKVAQNMKTLAAAIENAAYVNGYDATTGKIYKNASEEPITIADLGRDLDSEKYGIFYTKTTDEFDVAIVTTEAVDYTTAVSVVSGLAKPPADFSTTYGNYEDLGLDGTYGISDIQIVYTYTFSLY